MDDLIKKLPELVRPETIPEISKKIFWKSKIFGKKLVWDYIAAYYVEESESRVPFYLPYVYMKECYRYLCKVAGVSRKQVSMVLIDGGDSRTDYFLYEFLETLNYLTIITERPAYFEGLQERAFQELGLLIDLFLPWETKNIHGNLVWDFTEQLQNMDCYPSGSVGFIPHKKDCKPLNIISVTIDGAEVQGMHYSPQLAETFLVPRDFPFRESRCEELKKWCRQRSWTLKMKVRQP